MSVLTTLSIVQARVWVQNTEQASVNTFYYQIQTVTGGATTADFAFAFSDSIHAAYKGAMTSLNEYRGVQARDITLSPLRVMDVDTTDRGVGTLSGADLPRQSTVVTNWLTTLAGPRYRGRTYWPFPPASGGHDDGLPTTTYLGLLSVIANAVATFTTFTVSGRSATCLFGVYSRIPGIGFHQASSSETRSVFATMKKRGSNGRPNQSPI